MFTLKVDDDIELALVQPSFAKQYMQIVSEQRDYLAQWLAWPHHADSDAFFQQFITQSLHDYADGKSLVCAMIYHGDLVGNISFNTIDLLLNKVEVGYWLSSKVQGNGIVTRSVAMLIDYAFNELGMEKVQLCAATENTSSRKVAERLGFSLEGIITRSENLNGRVVDHAVYGLLRADNA
ncbi:Putative ribosomal N-acetyltransferase YdaF [Vibrio thalassae]|uniref:Ribosomal N-acetyltransferase YdaF n=1 Tax=Vibrio thalassae TaxID=1243014 RepID=A0A240ER97_9VIBR|nr:GNAT family protein [Vibrio thalassae]SNX50705.1 Putative ribosomal N-acetyltransferase YdaF [Vibrio thalassae]